jgi:Predicted membrane protein
MPILVSAFLIGIIAGLRAMMAPAMISWAACCGWLNLEGTTLHFFSSAITRWLFSLAVVGELVSDKLPKTPSRKVPPQFITRIVTGALSGAAIGAANQSLVLGLIAGAIGAVAGTYGGAALRGWLSGTIGKPLPAALIEDAIAIFGGLLIVSHL